MERGRREAAVAMATARTPLPVALPVRNRQLAFENDERDERDGFEHRPSLCRAADEPAADVVIGGPSRFDRGMTGGKISSLRSGAELGMATERYTSNAARKRPTIAPMPDETSTSLGVSDRVEAAYEAN